MEYIKTPNDSKGLNLRSDSFGSIKATSSSLLEGAQPAVPVPRAELCAASAASAPSPSGSAGASKCRWMVSWPHGATCSKADGVHGCPDVESWRVLLRTNATRPSRFLGSANAAVEVNLFMNLGGVPSSESNCRKPTNCC